MEIKDLLKEIQFIHDSGDCGKALSDVLRMATELNNQPSDLEIVQKALQIKSSSMEMNSNGEFWIYSSEYGEAYEHSLDFKSLIIWAKQMVGQQ